MKFEDFYKLTFRQVYSFLYYKCVNKSEVEDLAQESFLRLYQKYGDDITDEVEARKILFGIAKNVYRTWVSKRIHETKVEDIEQVSFDDNDEETELAEKEEYQKSLDIQRDIIKRAMKHLNPNVRSVLECRFLEAMTRKQVAEKLGMKEKDVHTYQKRGIKYLNKLINES